MVFKKSTDKGKEKEKDKEKEKVENEEKGKIVKKRRRRRKKFKIRGADSEDERVKRELNKRFGAKTAPKYKSEPACLRKNKDGTMSVCNSERHNKIIEKKAEELLCKPIGQSAPHDEYVATKWICAFCQQRTLRSVLGDLFGPYFVQIPVEHWPTFLAKKPGKIGKKSPPHTFDLWMHGVCALWAPGVQMCGTQLPDLDKKIVEFWKKHCAVCSKEGATIEINGKFFHFPCAYEKGYKLEESCECRSPDTVGIASPQHRGIVLRPY